MMSVKHSVVSLGILLMVAGLPVSAQPSTSGSPARQAQPTTVRAVHLVPSERLLKADVVGSDKKEIGEVNDLIIARHSGRVAYTLVGQGGLLGVGEHVVAVPFAALTWNDQDHNLSLPMTRDQLKSAPTVEGDDWKTLTESSRADQIARHFSISPDAIDPDGDDSSLHSKLQASEWPLLRVSELKGKKLMSDDGRELGSVNDLVIDTSTGRIAFGVVTFGGTLGFGSDAVAVPWPLFDVNKDGGLFATKLNKEQILAAPRLTEKDWAELKDPKFAPRVYSHYGIEAPWLERLSDAAGTTDPFSLKQYDQAYSSGTERTISGTISSINQTSPMKGLPEVTTLTIKTDKGESTIVQIAPKWYLDQNHIALKTGGTTSIKGHWAKVDGKDVLIATEVPGPDAKPLVLRKSSGEPTWTWR